MRRQTWRDLLFVCCLAALWLMFMPVCVLLAAIRDESREYR